MAPDRGGRQECLFHEVGLECALGATGVGALGYSGTGVDAPGYRGTGVDATGYRGADRSVCDTGWG